MRFPSRRLRKEIAAVIAACAILAACAREPRRPNILLVSIDTLRADHLGAYGYERNTSPAIDALAREGTVFENAWSTTSWTLPAHVSLMTGLPVSAHAQCDFDLQATEAVATHLPRGRFIAEDLAGASYDTAGFYSCVYLEPKFGFGAGFATWERAYHSFQSEPGVAERWKAARQANDVEAMKRIHAENPALFDSEARTAPVAVDSALDWLEKRGDDRDPFFLFVHVYDVHTGYTPPAPYDTLFDPDYHGTLDGRRLTDPESLFQKGMDPRELAHVIALYDGEIAGVDRELARLFQALERSGVAKDTLVIVTADHGEEFFEHGGKLHGSTLYREALHVPLIVKWPGHVPAGARRTEPVSLIDVAPTLRAAAVVESDVRLPGFDLLQPSFAPRELIGQVVMRRGIAEPFWLASLIDEREQIIVRHPGREDWSAERFDLTRDPREQEAPEHIDASSPDAAALLERLAAARAILRRLRDEAPVRARTEGKIEDAERMHLEALGYGGGATGESSHESGLCFDGCIWRP
ncbi:MAG TPA: sulfatase [Planctomycetota bacterium]|nr:sulfatase [Planctomycetota bacterium]